tara:strand:- start:3359 stop:3790 length:432 start_codon:yes stop_codon:yes gene_type:complete
MIKNYFDDIYDINYDLFGIVSNIKEYKLAWILNKIFFIDLVKIDDLIIKKHNRKVFQISNYLYQSDEFTIRLLKNKLIYKIDLNNEKFLIQKLSKFDYLFQIYNSSTSFNRKEIINKLNSESSIQFANFVNINLIKEKDLLLL